MESVRRREQTDWQLLIVTVLLLLGGTAIVLSASFPRARMERLDDFFYFKRQAVWCALAFAALFVGMRLPYWRWRKLAILGLVVSVVLLIVVMIPGIGVEVNGSRRWLGAGPMRFQPSELAKITLVLFLAAYADVWRGRITDFWRGFAPAVAIVGLVAGLIAKEDLGTAITAGLTGLLMIFMMGARPLHMLFLVGGALLAGVGLVVAEPYRIERIHSWLALLLRPFVIPSGGAYQPALGLVAMGNGGVSGQGIGSGGITKYLYLPAEHTDYIFATWGEETGLIGSLLMLAAFGWLVVRGLTIAHRTREWFGSLAAAGLTCIVGVQAVLNMAVVTCLVPCTGVPLPFISYGGSSLVFTTLAVGIILNVAQYPNRAAAGQRGEVRDARESRDDGWRNRRARLSGT